MTQPQLIPDEHRIEKIVITITDHSYQLEPSVGLRLDLTFLDGLQATVVHTQMGDGEIGQVPDEVRSLCDAFLWGDGPGAVIAWAQRLDRTLQSRRVQRSVRVR